MTAGFGFGHLGGLRAMPAAPFTLLYEYTFHPSIMPSFAFRKVSRCFVGCSGKRTQLFGIYHDLYHSRQNRGAKEVHALRIGESLTPHNRTTIDVRLQHPPNTPVLQEGY